MLGDAGHRGSAGHAVDRDADRQVDRGVGRQIGLGEFGTGQVEVRERASDSGIALEGDPYRGVGVERIDEVPGGRRKHRRTGDVFGVEAAFEPRFGDLVDAESIRGGVAGDAAWPDGDDADGRGDHTMEPGWALELGHV